MHACPGCNKETISSLRKFFMSRGAFIYSKCHKCNAKLYKSSDYFWKKVLSWLLLTLISALLLFSAFLYLGKIEIKIENFFLIVIFTLVGFLIVDAFLTVNINVPHFTPITSAKRVFYTVGTLFCGVATLFLLNGFVFNAWLTATPGYNNNPEAIRILAIRAYIFLSLFFVFFAVAIFMLKKALTPNQNMEN